MNKFILSGLFLLIPLLLPAQKFRTDVFSEQIKTLRVSVADNWEAIPVIRPERGETVEISFDLLGANPDRLIYSLVHCNADWTQSQLISSEYTSGFQNYILSDYALSFNTTMDYVNYRLPFPNDNATLNVSGNYVVQVFPEDDTSFPLLTACFSVLEEGEVSISAEVTPLTDKGMNTRYQAVNFEVNHGKEVRTPLQDLKVYVRQNNRLDNEARLLRPLSVRNQSLVYQHNPELIFEAGNEYRGFEMVTHRYNGLNIETIEFHDPYYHVLIKPDRMRTLNYSFNEDLNGRFYIRSLSGTEPDLEADYRFVHFYLPCEKELDEEVFLLGGAFHNILDKRSRMEYSPDDKGYVKNILLKEGYYNYLYVTRKATERQGSPSQVEGSFFQTENEYQIYVYHRPLGGRYDRLVAFRNIQHK